LTTFAGIQRLEELNGRRRQRMPFKDLREFIAKLEEEGEAIKIEEEVDWNLVVNSACDL